MENLLIIIISFFIFIYLILIISFKQKINKYKKENINKDIKIKDLELNVIELISELRKTNIELEETNRINNSNEFNIIQFEGINLKLEISKFNYENQKEERLNDFMKNYISNFIIWNESPDKQNMIGELFVYVKKE